MSGPGIFGTETHVAGVMCRDRSAAAWLARRQVAFSIAERTETVRENGRRPTWPMTAGGY